MKTALIGALVLAAVACGGGTKPDPTAPPMDVQKQEPAQGTPAGEGSAMAKHGGEHGEHGHSKMPPAVSKFHDTLAPRWHAERSAKRVTDTCAVIPQFRSEAAAIVATPAPEGANPSSWSAGGTQLVDAVEALATVCKTNDATAFEPAFERLHTAFHHVMEAGGAHRH